MYIDESGMDNREDYGYGWNELGKRYYDLKSGKRSLRVSIISGLCEGKLVAPLTFEGSCNRVVFEKWLGEKLLPQLKTGQLVILDNASFHKSQKVRELIESVNCELEYLHWLRFSGVRNCTESLIFLLYYSLIFLSTL